jgi:hypothetical protein
MRFGPGKFNKTSAIINIIISSINSSSCSSSNINGGGGGSDDGGGSCGSSISGSKSGCRVLVPTVANIDNNVRTNRLRKKRNSYTIYYGNILEDVHLEGQEEDGNVI